MPADFIDDVLGFIRADWVLIVVFGVLEWGFDQIKLPFPFGWVDFILVGLAIPLIITQLKGRVSYKRMLGYVVFSLCVFAVAIMVVAMPGAMQLKSDPEFVAQYGNAAYTAIVLFSVLVTGILWGVMAGIFAVPASLVGLAVIKKIGWKQDQPAMVK